MRAWRTAAIGATMVLLACPRAAGKAPTASEMGRVEALSGVRFPPSVRVRAWHDERGIDAYFELKFELPAPDWPAFLASSPFRSVTLDAKHRGDLGPDHDDWDPSRPLALVAAQVGLPDSRFVTLGADTSRPDVVVAYLVYFTT